MMKPMYFDDLLVQIEESVIPLFGKGEIVQYIPELSSIDPDQFGVAIATIDKNNYSAGKAFQPFSIQSISKAFTLTLALRLTGDTIWELVGKGACETSFNAIAPLEHKNGIPKNPFVNAGALIIADALISATDYPKEALLEFMYELCGNRNDDDHTDIQGRKIQYDAKVAESEKASGYRNAALANLLKSYGVLHNDVSDVLDFYYYQCSLSMSCMDIARSTLYLANRGYCPLSGKEVISLTQARRINALLFTCGMYEASGDFAFRIGLPGKSGVGGGIFAVVPFNLTICVWSPNLDQHGNSLIGIQALDEFVKKTELSIF